MSDHHAPVGDKVISKYKSITGVEKLSSETMERISKLEKGLDIRDDDAVWSIFIALDMYLRSIEQFNENIKTTFSDALLAYKADGGAINLIEQDPDRKFTLVNLVCVFGVALLLCAVCFAAGASLNEYSPAWIINTRASSPLAFIMQAPAGLLFFLLASVPAGYVFYKTARECRSNKSGTRSERFQRYAPTMLVSLMLALIGIYALILIL